MQAEWLAVFRELIRLGGEYESEHEVVAFVEQHLAARNIELHSIAFDATLRDLPGVQMPISTVSGRRNLVARIPGSGKGKSLVFSCHLDVVGAGDATAWTYPPFAAELADGAIYGRGACDNKAGAVVCIALLESLQARSEPLGGDVLVHFVIEDETSGNGTLLCLEAGYAADAAVIVDGTRFASGIDRHAGYCQFTITLRGKPVSVSVAHLGLNAAELLAELMLELRTAIHALNENRQAPWDCFPSPHQFAVQAMHAESEPSCIPARASARAVLTFTPPLTLRDMQAKLLGVAAGFFAVRGIDNCVDFDWSGFASEPVSTGSQELIDVLQQTTAQRGLTPPTFGPSTGMSDMRHFAARRIPCVLYGPGMGFNAHRPDEYYELSSFPKMLDIALAFATEWCRESA